MDNNYNNFNGDNGSSNSNKVSLDKDNTYAGQSDMAGGQDANQGTPNYGYGNGYGNGNGNQNQGGPNYGNGWQGQNPNYGYGNQGNPYGQGQYQYSSQGGYEQEMEVPVKMGEWLVSLLLMLVPCVNIVLMFVWAFSDKEKKSKSNFFKAYLIYTAIQIVLGFIWIVSYGFMLADLF